MQISSIVNNLIFKSILFIWILSIPFKNAIYQISVLLLIVMFIYHLVNTMRFDILIENFKKTKYLFIGFCFIVISMCISNLLNAEYLTSKSWYTVGMFIIRYGIIFIVLSYFYKLDYFKKEEVVITILLSLSLVMFTGFYQIIYNLNVLDSEGITGVLSNRNIFGLFMGMGLVLSILLLINKKILAFFLILAFSFFMIFSFSRSAWVSSIFAFLVFLIINYKKIKLNHLVYLVTFLFIILLIYLNFDSFQNRIRLLLDGYSSDRDLIWMHTITFIKEKIVFGYGMNSFKNLPDPLLQIYVAPHNMILENLIFIGTIGLLSFIFTFFIILRNIIITRNLILLPIASYFLIVTQFDFSVFSSKELLSFFTIFVFFVYADNFKVVK